MTVGLVGLGMVACQPSHRDARYSPSSERYAGPFSEDDARPLREQWDYVSNDPRTDGFIVLQDGEIVDERYVHMRPGNRHLYWSISMMVVGFIVSDLEDEGLVDVSPPIRH